jgi:DNA recombination protein RmuC
MILPILVAFGLGLVLGGWFVTALKNRRAAARTLELSERLSAAETLSRAEHSRRRELEAEITETQGMMRELDRQLAVAEERGKLLTETQQELEKTFSALASEALRGNAEQFLTLATEKLAASRTEAVADLEKRKQAIEALLQPLGESLGRLDRRAEDMERSRVSAYSRLDEQVQRLVEATQTLQDRTTSLATALKGSEVRGRWGEIALRNIAELAGMTKHCDFEEQTSLADGGRPDMTVYLPGGRRIAVDAKVPLSGYLEAVEAAEPERRTAALESHVKALRGHVRALADRNYAESLGENVDLVVLFLPGDPFLAAAFELDPDLQVDALRQKVLVATPTTLIALLRTVAIYWQQSSVVENAEAIAAAARELYERAAKFGEDLARLGRGLRTALEAYNAAIGSYDRRLMPMGRKLEEMKVTEHRKRSLASPEPIDETVRRSTGAPVKTIDGD